MSKPLSRRTIHWTELTEVPPGDALHPEWQVWRREMPRLLAAGYEGKYIVIKGEEILGPFEQFADASISAHHAYGLQRFLIRQVLENEPVLYLPHAG